MSVEQACLLFNRCLVERRDRDWRYLLEHYGERIRRVVQQAGRHVGRSLFGPDLDELVQDFYARLLVVPKDVFVGRKDGELWCFLALLARNMLTDRERARMARKRRTRDGDPVLEGLARGLLSHFDPEEHLLARERRRHFYERCLEFVRCDRALVELRILGLALLEGWSSREISRYLRKCNGPQPGIAPQHVDQLVCRFRVHLARQGIELPRRSLAA